MVKSQDILRGLSRKLFAFFAVIDVICLYVSGWLTYYLYFQYAQLPIEYNLALLASLCVNFVIFFVLRIYWLSTRVLFRYHFVQLIKGWTTLVLVLMGAAFLHKMGATYSRVWFMTWMLLYFLALMLNRYLLFALFDFMRARGLNQRRVAIIGCNAMSQTLIKRLDKSLWTGYKIIHLWKAPMHEATDGADSQPPATNIPENLPLFAQKNQLEEIWFVLSLKEIDTIKSLMVRFRELAIPIRMMLNADEFAFFEYTITDIAGFPALNLNASPMQGMNRVLKGLEDRLVAAAIVLMISPVLFAIAIGIKLTSKGPVFFKQKRLGWDGKIITVYKFRTMYEHQERAGVVTQATANDQRITPFGRWLRKTSLDELPQFINVLQGRMSIVGPRPHALSHNDEYKNVIYAYMQRHRVKPGITGWAQVNGWRGETDTLLKMEKRVEYDLYYINNWSLAFDFKIIWLTLFKGFVHQNAY